MKTQWIPLSYWACFRLDHSVSLMDEVKGLEAPDKGVCLIWRINNLHVSLDYKVWFWPWPWYSFSSYWGSWTLRPSPYLPGEDEPSTISSFSRKEGKKNLFFHCKFHFYVFYNLSWTAIEVLFTKINQCGNAAIKLGNKLLRTSFNLHILLCIAVHG